jgi:methylmalonyl-CoA epimerase
MFTKVHHVTYVVEDLAQMAEYLKQNFGMEPERREEQPTLGYRTMLYRVGETLVDFFEPLRDANGDPLVPRPPATGFVRLLRESGPGIWHVAWGVNQIDDVFATLKQKGTRLLGEQVRRDSVFGYKIVSIDPMNSHGVFFQLAEGDSAPIDASGHG